QVGIGDLFGGRNSQWFRQRSWQLWRANRRKCRNFSLPLSLEKTRERAATREHAHQRAIAGTFVSPRGHKGANIGRAQLGELLQGRRGAQMVGQKAQEL